jgi:hypothetical protein
MNYILVAVALSVGNFAFQIFGNGDWLLAAERSYFQAFALFMLWLGLRLGFLSQPKKAPLTKSSD